MLNKTNILDFPIIPSHLSCLDSVWEQVVFLLHNAWFWGLIFMKVEVIL